MEPLDKAKRISYGIPVIVYLNTVKQNSQHMQSTTSDAISLGVRPTAILSTIGILPLTLILSLLLVLSLIIVG